MSSIDNRSSGREPLCRIVWFVGELQHKGIDNQATTRTSISEHVRRALDDAIAAGTAFDSEFHELSGEMIKHNYWISGHQKEWLIRKVEQLSSTAASVLRMSLYNYLRRQQNNEKVDK